MGSTKDKGRIFHNYVDFLCYGMLTLSYPAVTYCFQIKQTDFTNFQSVFTLLFVTFMFTLSFFYDFYSKFLDRDKEDLKSSAIFDSGKMLFGALSVGIFFLMIFASLNFNIVVSLKFVFYILPLSALFPLRILIRGFKYLRKKDKQDSQDSQEKELIGNAVV